MKKGYVVAVGLVALLGTNATFAQDDKVEKKKIDSEEMFKKMDTDGDGKLSRTEVDKADRPMLKNNFTIIDKNSDSYLDKEELREFKKKHRQEK